MCGRTALSLDKELIRCACSYKIRHGHGDSYVKPEWLHEHNDGKEYVPSYNIAPTDVSPVLISSSKYRTTQSDSIRIIKPMMWGIIPPWHKGDYHKHNLSTNNCRLENIRQSKLYNPILLNGGRCIIVVEGYYEWQTTIKTKVKQPYYIYASQEEHIKSKHKHVPAICSVLDDAIQDMSGVAGERGARSGTNPARFTIDEPDTFQNSYNDGDGWNGLKLLYIAGLYNTWQNDDIILYSYSIITMDSNNTLDWLHHRMPAILDTEVQIEAWLDIDNVNADMALSYLKPSKLLSWHQVSTAVNNSRYKSDDCIKRISKEKCSQKSITTWFTKTEKRKINDEEYTKSKKFK
ncbi:unnamed protein product [Parnassius apollo]|uniref:(apollo) hypothetical protein n=1 Tax=Parnassius apollo TaxID=110799 RepID=A0A8S3X0H7_PARAO|nr:unnamed protein product [Parnassius apollo]